MPAIIILYNLYRESGGVIFNLVNLDNDININQDKVIVNDNKNLINGEYYDSLYERYDNK